MLKVTNFYWGDDMRERRYLTFDMQNPRHIEAFELFSAQPNKLRSEYVVNCILESQVENRMEKTMRHVITEALKDVSFSVAVPQDAKANIQTTKDISDLPDVLLSSLDEI
jgi:hypothetical protein